MERSQSALSLFVEALKVLGDAALALVIIFLTQLVKVITIICLGFAILCRWVALFLEVGGIAACGILMWIAIFTIYGRDTAAAYLAFLLVALMLAWGLLSTRSFVKTLGFMLFGAAITVLIENLGILFASATLAVGLAIAVFASFVEVLPEQQAPAVSEIPASDQPAAASGRGPDGELIAPKKELVEQPDGSYIEKPSQEEPVQLPLPFPNTETQATLPGFASQTAAGGN